MAATALGVTAASSVQISFFMHEECCRSHAAARVTTCGRRACERHARAGFRSRLPRVNRGAVSVARGARGVRVGPTATTTTGTRTHPRPPRIAPIACPAASDARRSSRVLAAHGAERSDLVIRVTTTGDRETSELRLLVERSNGEIGLDRTYPLGPSDCESAAELLALGVDRFLSSFPEWAGPPPPPPPPAPPPTRWLDVTVISAINSIWNPLGVDGQAGALVDLGARRHRFGGSAIVRASVPQAAGNGRFQQTAFLAGATYRHRAGPWAIRAEARAGALLVSGIHARTARLAAVVGRRGVRWARIRLGNAGIEPPRRACAIATIARDGLVEEDIPLLRWFCSGLRATTK
jgi:hypothetical protein